MAGPAASPSRVPFVGLTGGLGAGKSTALQALERLGAATLSTDAVVHELYASDAVRDAVVERWGPDVAPGGVVDRRRHRAPRRSPPRTSARGSRACCGRSWAIGSPPGTRRSRRAIRRRVAAVVETPLLFEAGLESRYDATIAVVADEAVRAERAAARGHAAVDERAARQLPQEEKAARATYVVRNHGSVEDLEHELSAVLGRLMGG